MAEQPRTAGHVLAGYVGVLEIRATTLPRAARTAGRERGLWLHAWRFREDPDAEPPQLVWLRRDGLPALEVVRVYIPEIRALAAQHGITGVRAVGAVAAGEEDPESPLELLVEGSADTGEDAVVAFGAAVGGLVGRHVEPLIETSLDRDLRNQLRAASFVVV